MTVVEYHKYIDFASVDAPKRKKRLYLEVLENVLLKALEIDTTEEVDVLIDIPR